MRFKRQLFLKSRQIRIFPLVRFAIGASLSLFYWCCLPCSFAQQVAIPFLAANDSYFDPLLYNLQPITNGARTLIFTMPLQIFQNDQTGFYSDLTNGSGGAVLDFPPSMNTYDYGPPPYPYADPTSGQIQYETLVNVSSGEADPGETLDQILADNTSDTPTHVTVKMIVQGGWFAGTTINLSAAVAYDSSVNYSGYPAFDNGQVEQANENLWLVINWGTDPGGYPIYILVEFQSQGEVASQDISTLPLGTILSDLNVPDPGTFANNMNSTILSQITSGALQIQGAIPELLNPTTSSGYGDANAPYAQAHDKTRDPTSGGPVDLATLGETVNHPLLTLSGARSLEFTISYDSTLSGGDQYITPTNGGGAYWTLYTPGDIGHWTHNFEGQATYVSGSGGSSNEVIILISHRRWTYFQNGNTYQTFDQSSAYDSLAKNADGSYTLTTKDQSTYTFSGTGLFLTRVTNPHGHAIVISRNNAGQITTITEPVSGKYFSIIYGTSGNSAGRITTVTDSAGRSVGFAYDTNSMLTQITEANGSPTSFIYDSSRHLLTEADAQGNVLTSNTYITDPTSLFPIGSVTNQMDARGNNFAYSDLSQNGTNVTSVQDRNNFLSYYYFDTNHNLIEYSSPDTENTTYTYDTNGNLLTKTDPLTNLTSYAYDAYGNVTNITDALGQTTVLTYDGRHNLLTVTNPDNDYSVFTYDTNNNLLTAKDSLGHQIIRTYDTNSLLLNQTNPNGGVSTNTYANGLLTSHTDAAGDKETMTYDAVGNLATLTDPTGATTTYHYGTLRQLLEADDAAGNKVDITYDWRLRVSTITDPSGAVTSYAYDGNNNILAITNALQQVTTFAYDKEDRPISVTDPLGNTIYESYDADGRLIETTNAVGNTVEYTYDDANNLLTVVDGIGNIIITNAYDACNQIIALSDSLGRTSKLSYDKAQLLASTQDPLGLVNSFVHDALGRTTTVNAPLSTTNSQTFDADGNRTAIINANNKSTAFMYDVADRLTQFTTATGKATTYAYNNRNLPSSITLPSGTSISLTYDALGRITNAVDPIGTITYTYDNNGRVIGTAQIISGTTKTISRQFDLLGRLTQFTDSAGNVLKYAYDAAGNLITLTYPDGKQISYGYDAARRLTSVTDWASRVTSYTYDVDSRVATITRPDRSTETFTYDAAGQITNSVDLTASNNVIQSIAYSYDADSEITGENTTPAPGIYHPVNLTLTVDADNRLATINQQAAVYDNNGNLISATIPGSAISNLTYDARNRLVSAGGITNAYDAENRRISVASSAGTNIYVINPNAGLDQILVKTAPNGTVTRYVYGLGLIGEETGSAFTTYHYDHRGSTTALTDINGNVLNTFNYGANGEPVGFNPATAPTPFLYGGRYGVLTDANGLCYMRARYYMPAISCFINQDIVLGNIASGNSMNRFAYANSDPIDNNDPFGLCADTICNNPISFLSGLSTIYGIFANSTDVTVLSGYKALSLYGNNARYSLAKVGGGAQLLANTASILELIMAASKGSPNVNDLALRLKIDSSVNIVLVIPTLLADAMVSGGTGTLAPNLALIIEPIATTAGGAALASAAPFAVILGLSYSGYRILDDQAVHGHWDEVLNVIKYGWQGDLSSPRTPAPDNTIPGQANYVPRQQWGQP